ncbi:MAG: hypothetical protein JSW35_00080 [Deltaproteobacteria bacterium]|nr:MAG: hypothetical protein JSW35_00080 [Deltaproteobacteria bacterium]
MEMIVDETDSDIIKYGELNDLFYETTIVVPGHGRLKKLVQSSNSQIKRASYRSFAQGVKVQKEVDKERG